MSHLTSSGVGCNSILSFETNWHSLINGISTCFEADKCEYFQIWIIYYIILYINLENNVINACMAKPLTSKCCNKPLQHSLVSSNNSLESSLVSGQCPATLTVVPSLKGCASDRDCSGGHKCCRFDCGPVCVPPVFSEFQLMMDTWGLPEVTLEKCFHTDC